MAVRHDGYHEGDPKEFHLHISVDELTQNSTLMHHQPLLQLDTNSFHCGAKYQTW